MAQILLKTVCFVYDLCGNITLTSDEPLWLLDRYNLDSNIMAGLV